MGGGGGGGGGGGWIGDEIAKGLRFCPPLQSRHKEEETAFCSKAEEKMLQ